MCQHQEVSCWEAQSSLNILIQLYQCSLKLIYLKIQGKCEMRIGWKVFWWLWLYLYFLLLTRSRQVCSNNVSTCKPVWCMGWVHIWWAKMWWHMVMVLINEGALKISFFHPFYRILFILRLIGHSWHICIHTHIHTYMSNSVVTFFLKLTNTLWTYSMLLLFHHNIS